MPDKNKSNFTKVKIILLMLESILSAAAMVIFVFIYGEEKSRDNLLPEILAAAVIVFSFIMIFKILLPLIRINRSLIKLKTSTENAVEGLKKTGLEREFCELLEYLNSAANQFYTSEILRKQAEIDALQSQINPHFLYNTLEVIRGQAMIEKSEIVASMAKALATMFRFNISEKGILVSLRDELNNVDSYMTIQRFRFKDKYSIIYEFDNQSNIIDYMIPKLTIQPLVENAIVHGLETKVEGGCIALKIQVKDYRMIIRVSDDGVGMSDDQLKNINLLLRMPYTYKNQESGEKSNGIALKNVNERIKMIFGNEYGLSVYSTLGHGTDVEVVIPVTEKNI